MTLAGRWQPEDRDIHVSYEWNKAYDARLGVQFEGSSSDITVFYLKAMWQAKLAKSPMTAKYDMTIASLKSHVE